MWLPMPAKYCPNPRDVILSPGKSFLLMSHLYNTSTKNQPEAKLGTHIEQDVLVFK